MEAKKTFFFDSNTMTITPAMQQYYDFKIEINENNEEGVSIFLDANDATGQTNYNFIFTFYTTKLNKLHIFNDRIKDFEKYKTKKVFKFF